jgi:hypothetical protein
LLALVGRSSVLLLRNSEPKRSRVVRNPRQYCGSQDE